MRILEARDIVLALSLQILIIIWWVGAATATIALFYFIYMNIIL